MHLDEIQSSNYKPCRGFPALNCIVIRPKTAIIISYSDFQSYKVHLSPLIACGEGVGGGVLVPQGKAKLASA